MERVAAPLREMGATVTTTDGHAPVEIVGGSLYGISFALPIPTAQVKGAVLLAGIAAEGETSVTEPAATRDHTERALAALGAPVSVEGTTVTLQGVYQHEAFAGDGARRRFVRRVPRCRGRADRIGADRPRRRPQPEPTSLPGGDARGWACGRRPPDAGRSSASRSATCGSVRVRSSSARRSPLAELPLVIDEVPVLALLATHARGETWFMGAAELRAKESDRLAGVADGIRALGGHAGVEGDDLVVPGLGLRGGVADGRGDHRLAMAFAVAALAADSPSEIEGMEAADVSFPGFLETLRALGASVEDIT